MEIYGDFEQVNGAVVNDLNRRIKELEIALADVRLFAVLVDSWGKPDCEIYKHELRSSACLSLERIDKVLTT